MSVPNNHHILPANLTDHLLPEWPEWIQTAINNRPIRRGLCFLFEPLWDPISSSPLPPFLSLFLIFCGALALVLFASSSSLDSDSSSSGEAAIKTRQQRSHRRKKRRQPLWRWFGIGDQGGWLRALPLYSLIFAYIAAVSTETAVEVGFLRLPPKISQADWFEKCTRLIKMTSGWIKYTDLGIVMFSLIFSEGGMQRALHTLNQGRQEHEKVELRWPIVATILTCEVLLWGASYAAVALSAILLFASLLIFVTAQIPLIVYDKNIYRRLSKSFLGRYLNGEIEKFFKEHEFLRVADDYKSLVLPFTVLGFFLQVNLLLCSFHLLQQTRQRVARYNLIRRLDLQLHFSRLWKNIRSSRRGAAAGSGGGWKLRGTGERGGAQEAGAAGLTTAAAAAAPPVVKEGLHKALGRARQRRRGKATRDTSGRVPQ